MERQQTKSKKKCSMTRLAREIDRALCSRAAEIGIHPNDGFQRKGNEFGFVADTWNVKDDDGAALREFGSISVDFFGERRFCSVDDLPGEILAIGTECLRKAEAAAEFVREKLRHSRGLAKMLPPLVDHLSSAERCQATMIARKIERTVNVVAKADIIACFAPMTFQRSDWLGLSDDLKFGIEIHYGAGLDPFVIPDFRNDPFGQAADFVSKMFGALPKAALQLRKAAA